MFIRLRILFRPKEGKKKNIRTKEKSFWLRRFWFLNCLATFFHFCSIFQPNLAEKSLFNKTDNSTILATLIRETIEKLTKLYLPYCKLKLSPSGSPSVPLGYSFSLIALLQPHIVLQGLIFCHLTIFNCLIISGRLLVQK